MYSSFDHKVTSSVIIILKTEVSPRQPLGTPKTGRKSKENDPVITRLALGLLELLFHGLGPS